MKDEPLNVDILDYRAILVEHNCTDSIEIKATDVVLWSTNLSCKWKYPFAQIPNSNWKKGLFYSW